MIVEAELELPEILIPAARIQGRVAELGAEILRDYAGQELLLVVLLKGAFVFAADLLRSLPRPLQVEFMTVRSYRGQESGGALTIVQDLAGEIRGRHLLLVEDIVDTGRTLHALLPQLQQRQPASLAVCALLDKPSRRLCPVPVRYVGFEIADRFVVGYGLDHEQHYRQLPYLGLLPAAPGKEEGGHGQG